MKSTTHEHQLTMMTRTQQSTDNSAEHRLTASYTAWNLPVQPVTHLVNSDKH